MTNKSITLSISLSLVICTIVFTTGSYAAKLYKWVDADGNISYQDTPPPTSAKQVEETGIETSTRSTIRNAPLSEAQQSNPVVVYTLEDCDACIALLSFFRENSVPFQEQSILDRDVQNRILSVSEKVAAPTLFLGDRLIENLTHKNLTEQLKSAGYLAEEPEPVDQPLDDDSDRLQLRSESGPVDESIIE